MSPDLKARTECSVIAIDARYVDEIGLIEVALLTKDDQPAMFLAHPRDHEVLARSLADPEVLVSLPTYQLITDLDVTPLQDES